MRNIWLLIVAVFLSGCLVRTYTVEKPRVDTDMTGNQGCIFGECEPEEVDLDKAARLSDTRKVTVLEWELGFGKPKFIREVPKSLQEEQEVAAFEEDIWEEEEFEVEEEVREEVREEAAYDFYTIQKKDTLQKISYKFYGTSRKWKKIYEFNKDKLRDPNKIYPGLTIKIPRL